MPPHSALFRAQLKFNSFHLHQIRPKSLLHIPPLFPLRSNPRNLISSIRTTVSLPAIVSSFGCNKGLVFSRRHLPFPHFQQHQQLGFYGRVACDEKSEDESEREVEVSKQNQQTGVSTINNVEDWKWKLTMLLRNNNDKEVVSKEKKDRRDFLQLAALAARMGLYSRHYTRVIVFSKFPLPNYRSDLDDKRPQREVFIDSGLHQKVDTLLKEYLSQRRTDKGTFAANGFPRSSTSHSFAGISERHEPQYPVSAAMKNALHRRSFLLRDQQQAWQESVEGEKMLEFRKGLPAYKEKDSLLTAISENQVVVVSGETGCGKTTQLPQYILESEIVAARGAGCSIICTQPRRISAMAVSERVAAERGEKLGESVGYKVRLEGIRGKDTRLLFCTTGILLRRLLVDRNLKGVTHVIVDEIHERGMNEDFLLIVLKELLPRRPELRLILMSATLNAELFSSYFGGAPMIHIPGFTYPVRTHFLENILETTGYRLTPGNQIDDYGQDKLWKMQKQSMKKKKSQIASVVEDTLQAADFRGYSVWTRDSLSCWNPDSIGWDDINALKDKLQANFLLGDPRRVLLLACHGSMASSEQRLIFDKPEDGVRKIVLATNMAETSITINDVVFVVDCGKAKETSYDALNNTPCLLPSWVSKAAARQRRGRAGRVQSGECYHLYPKCVYEAFADYQLPELLRTPLQSLCLQIKSLQFGSISEFLSMALQSPEVLSVDNAVEYLKVIGALDDKENLTALGRYLAILPMEPKLGKMLIFGAIFKCVDPILTVVAGLSVRDPFLMPFDKKDNAKLNLSHIMHEQENVLKFLAPFQLAESAKLQFSRQGYSDHIALIRAYNGWKDIENEKSRYEYCHTNFLSAQTLKAIDSLRKQFFFQLKGTGLIDEDQTTSNAWSHDEHLIRAVTCAGLYPGVCSVVNKKKYVSLKTLEDVNAGEQKIPYPWLVFNEKVKVNSVFLRDSTAISDSLALLFGGNVSRGELNGHLKMFGGYLEFFMNPSLAETYLRLKGELDELIQEKLLNPKMDIQSRENLLAAVRLLISGDKCEGRFVYGVEALKQSKTAATAPLAQKKKKTSIPDDNSKGQLQTILSREGHPNPTYTIKQLDNSMFRAMVFFNGMQFRGKPCSTKKNAEKEAAIEALQWLTGTKSDFSNISRVPMLPRPTKNNPSTRRKT
ncbi:hypothetical protein GIB67_036441 [Kingdonia uniflora]|uniref:RNA helicase n=1 Tax=Kingdonia uniflora TaxID=39325 RepID=A0A7J7L4B9_9MAGN|nr:hypothetical protein GIB67_036441 [Kingdonia uniflora]